MDELALRTLVTNLEASRSSDHWWLEVCTALVAVGVLFEVIFVIWEYVDELHDFRRGVVHPPERPNIILFALGLLGAALVAIGVAGEFRFEAKIESTETRIRKANDDLFLLLSKEAGDAATSAKTARDEADAAIKSASDAKIESDAATELAKEAESKAKNVGKRAEEISGRLDIASQQLSHVEEQVRAQGPRSKLLIDGAKAFVEALEPFRGQKVIFVTCAPRQSPLQTDEEYEFELNLLNHLTEPRPGSVPGAGWKTYAEGRDSWYPCKASGWARGVWVMYSAQSAKAAAEALGSALNKLKISAQTTWFNPKDADEYARQKRQPNDFNALWEKVAREPAAIYVLTGEHP